MSAHYTDYNSFTGALLGFVRESREVGFMSGMQISQDTMAASLKGLWLDKTLFEYALASLFCTSPEDREVFSSIYKRFWLERGTRIKDQSNYKNQKRNRKNLKNVAVVMGRGSSTNTALEEEAKSTSGANSTETLKNTDFAKLSLVQTDLLEDISQQLIKEMTLRLSRRQTKSKSGYIDLSKSIRRNLQFGGNVLDLIKTKQKKDKYNLLVLLDVSGSMDKYSFYLLKFLWSLKAHFKQIEAFAFSTDIQRITDYIDDKDISSAMAMVSHNVTHWSSGTEIGKCLQSFNDKYARRYLNGRTITIILSDGLDTGETEVLDKAVKKIKLKSKTIVWLNPLKGMKGYEPIQRGMKVALPTLDHFGSAHNFQSLLNLEQILLDA